MKTAVVGPFPPYRGGIAQFSGRLLETLRGAFPSDMTGAVSYRRLYPGFLFPGTSQKDPAGWRGEGVAEPAPEELLDSLDPFAWPRTRRILTERAYDRMIVQWWHPFFAPCLSRSLPGGVPTAAVCHNVRPHEGFPMGRRLASSFLRRVDLLVVHSASDAEEAERISGRDRVLRLYHPLYDQYLPYSHGRSASRSLLGYSAEDMVVLFFGLVRPYKGLDDLITAMAMLPAEVKLLVAGESYMDRGPMLRSIEAAGLSGRVRWDDRFVQDREVALYFETADIVALPYRTATQSGVAQIALSFGKPLVLADTGGLGELVDEGSTGCLTPPGCPESLAGAIVSCLRLSLDPDIRERILRKSLQFSWEGYASSLMKALS
jgi:glycosyltransferase involved in cell wall biosynthesis